MTVEAMDMRQALLEATELAILAVTDTRFYATERGFHGRFYCALQNQLDQIGVTANGTILEMEYQKSRPHSTWQRPDIILHVPVEHSHASVIENNLAVWALKRRASTSDAISDFSLLDDMFQTLHYPLGFFLNIDSLDPMAQHYTGPFRNRLLAVAAQLSVEGTNVEWDIPTDSR